MQEKAEKDALESALATKLSDSEENEAEYKEDEDVLNLVFPPLPQCTWKPPPEVPPEKIGSGANAQVK